MPGKKSAPKAATAKPAGRKAQPRTKITVSKNDTRYVRRKPAGTSSGGEFTKDQVDRSRSLKADNNQKSKTKTTRSGFGDKGDRVRKPASKKRA
jgi:hypothetical protein